MIKNLDKVSSKKRQNVRRGMEYIDRMNAIEPVIDKIVVFGSAVSDDCREDSDIDVCLFSQFNNQNQTYRTVRGRLMDEMDDVCDIIRYDRLNDAFKEVIDKGVVVYEL